MAVLAGISARKTYGNGLWRMVELEILWLAAAPEESREFHVRRVRVRSLTLATVDLCAHAGILGFFLAGAHE
jgi:hypothetical protein